MSPGLARARGARVALALALALVAGCGDRGCGATPPPSRGDDAGLAGALARLDRARCRAELERGAVGVAPGGGAVDAVVPACDADERLALWVLRGHTLSVLSRGLEPGATFAPPVEVSTGADRLGAPGERLAGAAPHEGLAAWRAPTAGIDNDEPGGAREVWWAGRVALRGGSGSALDGGGARSERGSVALPPGVAGLGALAAVAGDASAALVLGTLASPEREPSLSLVRVPWERGGAPEPEGEGTAPSAPALPAALALGELRAYEPETRTALVFALRPDGGAELRALRFERAFALAPGAAREPPRELGRVPLAGEHVLVAARGVAAPGGREALFAYSEFAVVRGASERRAGRCVLLDETLCVRPSPPALLVAGAAGARTVAAGPRGASAAPDAPLAPLVDAVSVEPSTGRAALLALYAGGGAAGEAPAARGAVTLVDLRTGAHETRALAAAGAGALPPLDHPALVRCGGALWLSAEAALGLASTPSAEDALDAGPAAPTERAVLAVPLACALAE